MTIALRPYQIEARDAVLAAWERGQCNALVMLATGLGKTEVGLAAWAEDQPERGLWLAHRTELIDQPLERIGRNWPTLTGAAAVMADRNGSDARLIMGSVQTLCRERRMTEVLRHGPISHLILDEAHHAPASTYQDVLAAIGPVRHLGLTATPERTDKIGLAPIYGKRPVYRADIKWGVETGYLARPIGKRVLIPIDLDNVSKGKGGDFTNVGLAAVMETRECFDVVLDTHQNEAAGRLAMAFTPSVEGAHELARLANERGIWAEAVDDKTPADKRRAILDEFRVLEGNGILCNFGIFTEGFDAPRISALHMLRPTKSVPLYVQMAGRGLRIAEGKTECLIFDYTTEDRELVVADDLLGRKARAVRARDIDPSITEFPGCRFDTEDTYANLLSGDREGVVYADLDLLPASKFAWHEHRGVWVLPITWDLTGVLVPLNHGSRWGAYLYDRANKAVQALKISDRPAVATLIEDFARTDGQRGYYYASRRRLSDGATDRQWDWLRRWGYDHDTRVSGGEADSLIRYQLATAAIRQFYGG